MVLRFTCHFLKYSYIYLVTIVLIHFALFITINEIKSWNRQREKTKQKCFYLHRWSQVLSSDRKKEITATNSRNELPSKAGGLSPRLNLLVLNIKRRQLRCFRQVLLRLGPEADSGQVAEIVSCLWLGNTLMYLGRAVRGDWEKGSLGFSALTAAPVTQTKVITDY